MKLDRRLNAFRPDLASRALMGTVEAERFVEGAPGHVGLATVALRPRPDLAAGIDTELLFGEPVRIFENRDGWAWVQSDVDSYVGYLPASAIETGEAAATHWVTVPRTFVYPEAELRRPALKALSMGSRVRLVGESELRNTRYGLLSDGSAIVLRHLAPLGHVEADYVGIAARFVETPYLWGGRSGFGIDCSGLVQLAMMMAGLAAPRDSDMQASDLGEPISGDSLTRGDLVFWKGHVAIMEDTETMLHANGYTMTVAREPFRAAIDRISPFYGMPTAYRRPMRLSLK